MFQRLIDGDLLTGKVTNPTVQIPIHQARRAFRGKSEKDVLFLWKKIDTILSKWVAANRQTPPKPADYGLEDADTPKGCLRRLPGLDDAELVRELLFRKYLPLQRLIDKHCDSKLQVWAALTLHEAVCGRVEAVRHTAHLLSISETNLAKKSAPKEMGRKGGKGKKGKEGPVKATVRVLLEEEGARNLHDVIAVLEDRDRIDELAGRLDDPVSMLTPEVDQDNEKVRYRTRKGQDKQVGFKQLAATITKVSREKPSRRKTRTKGPKHHDKLSDIIRKLPRPGK